MGNGRSRSRLESALEIRLEISQSEKKGEK